MHRRHDLDTLRIAAFALLILYHAAMAYVAGWDFHLKSAYTAEWLQWPMIAMNRWRMPLLFAISGIALGLSLPEHGRWRHTLRRCWRLQLPLLFGIVAVVSLQAYYEALDNGDVAPGLARFLWRYWQFRPWPGAHFSGAAYGFTWNHLWYLAYLLPYTVLAVVLASLLRPLRGALPRWQISDRVLGGLLLVLPVAWLAWTLLVLMPRWPPTHALLDDVYVHAESLPLFLGGFMAARWQRGWELLVRGRRLTLALAGLGLCVELGIRALARLPHVGDVDAWVLALPWGQTERIGRALYTWCMLLALFGWARVLLSRPWPGLAYCREAVFSWYILHQTVLIVLLYALRPLQLGPWLEPALLVAGTIGGCLLIHELLIRRVRWLRPLFGLRAASPSLPVARVAPV
ncbi:acyltransferase family protein [Stenotrophomonas sp.]|uniref:acyltransferase family protein n=1 Tax=Stenotrophomonas sp. TaxID=69392 RepID=UPI0028A96689|nr:acyltransferase family protein [Stenotrophomonas sp.]